MNRMRNAWLALLGALMVLISGTAQAALQITDDNGVVVTFERSPQRIVSLLPSLAETVCELGQCQRLVGVDRYSTYPASLTKLPRWAAGWTRTLKPLLRCGRTWCW